MERENQIRKQVHMFMIKRDGYLKNNAFFLIVSFLIIELKYKLHELPQQLFV